MQQAQRDWRSERVCSSGGDGRMAPAERKKEGDEGTGGTRSVYIPAPTFGQGTPN